MSAMAPQLFLGAILLVVAMRVGASGARPCDPAEDQATRVLGPQRPRSTPPSSFMPRPARRPKTALVRPPWMLVVQEAGSGAMPPCDRRPPSSSRGVRGSDGGCIVAGQSVKCPGPAGCADYSSVATTSCRDGGAPKTDRGVTVASPLQDLRSLRGMIAIFSEPLAVHGGDGSSASSALAPRLVWSSTKNSRPEVTPRADNTEIQR